MEKVNLIQHIIFIRRKITQTNCNFSWKLTYKGRHVQMIEK